MIILKSKHTEYFRIREPGIQLQLLSGQLSILQRNPYFTFMVMIHDWV